jgi:hypothetical protein
MIHILTRNILRPKNLGELIGHILAAFHTRFGIGLTFWPRLVEHSVLWLVRLQFFILLTVSARNQGVHQTPYLIALHLFMI